ncbi:MAG: GTPase HflX [Candidatus Delongbacteria bacterium]|nr:GTPase HflX [Candidatus Delongbacteria bacterium]MCG2760194.1 GTPase HflX [Candidatus Delongbacteria bacterium]
MESIPTTIPKPRAFLIGVCLDNREYAKSQRSIDELERLADTAEIEVVEKFIQNRKVIDKTTYVGKGFLEDIKTKMEMADVQLVIFDNEIAPTQARNIKRDYDIEALDRTEIILDIFHKHAKTKEAKFEVRLAELKYQLPRLKKLWSHLDRERGASGSVSGASRGMGEKQIEIDRRIVKDEIRFVTHELERIMTQKRTQRKSRESAKKICLVGYTNAGKSSLFNKITGENVLVEDKLFATLDSTARSLELGKGENIIISDTIGFISNLPHNLIASFRATLKDIMDADLLLHLVDISDDNCEEHIKAVNEVLKEIGADKIPAILTFNKIDLLGEYRVREEIFVDKYKGSVFVSAVTGENVDYLLKSASDKLNQTSRYNLLFPFEEQKSIANMHEYAIIISKEFTDYGVSITAIVNKENLYKVEKFIIKDQL